jgi:formate hydrogenlyase transcriptional activator
MANPPSLSPDPPQAGDSSRVSEHRREHSRRQVEAFFEVWEAIAQHRELGALFHDLSKRLHGVVEFDSLLLMLFDSARNVMRLHLMELSQSGSYTGGEEMSLEDAPWGWVFETQKPFLVLDTNEEARFPGFLAEMKQEHARSLVMLPLTTAQRRLGVMIFAKEQPHPYRGEEMQFLQRVVNQVAVAVDNALNFARVESLQKQFARERDRLQVLLDINNALVSNLALQELFQAIVTALARVMHHDYTSLALYDSSNRRMRIQALDFPPARGLLGDETGVPFDASPAGQALTSRQPYLADRAELSRYDTPIIRLLLQEGVQTVCCVPLLARGSAVGTLNLASRRENAFRPEDVELLQQVAGQVAIAVQNALAFNEIDALKNKLAEEKLYLEEEIRSELNFEDIVGESPALRKALSQVETVATANSTVLILGETGTGKELIARAIHNLSPRRERTFVKVNCAAIPTGLLESELFGHERGAFTGAITQKIGRFELADKGTLFLDEVADIPLELQPKLLRVLQEQEFERLGGTHTIHADVRLVAATNRDLAPLVAERAFRSDLYYRLNVFPIQVPPLRERASDIPLLVRYFVQKFSRRLNKPVQYIPVETMEALVSYSWPGNVRELENLIERAVLLSSGNELRVPLAELGADTGSSLLSPASTMPIDDSLSTLEEAERQHILRALRRTRWVIGGPKGAAAILGVKRTTLQARMRKLGIRRPS